MAKKQKRPRLKKNPEIPDYVVEFTDYVPGGRRQSFDYFMSRSAARDAARVSSADRTRVFHMTFKLVSDRK